jgi:hypothetical protein
LKPYFLEVGSWRVNPVHLIATRDLSASGIEESSSLKMMMMLVNGLMFTLEGDDAAALHRAMGYPPVPVSVPPSPCAPAGDEPEQAFDASGGGSPLGPNVAAPDVANILDGENLAGVGGAI